MKRSISIVLFGLLLLAPFLQAQYLPVANLAVESIASSSVTLRWDVPQGQIVPQYFEIWRTANGGPNSFEFLAQVTTDRFTDYKVTAGADYTYAIVAFYSALKRPTSYLDVSIPKVDNRVVFVTRPVTTARVGQMYRYFFEIIGDNLQDIEFSLSANTPSQIAINHIYDNEHQQWLHFLDWTPSTAGAYDVGIVAHNRTTGADEIQEFVVNVADHPGKVRGRVLDASFSPVRDCFVRLIHLAADGATSAYQCYTDSTGVFELQNVQEGRLYAYAQAPGDSFTPQWYSNAASLANALVRYLRENDSLTYDFTLLPNTHGLTKIEGSVATRIGEAIQDVRISFIRKSRFIQIGDTSNVNNPMFQSLISMGRDLADTSVLTDANGHFEVYLPVDYDYYTIAEKAGFLRAFSSDQRNALEARALRVTAAGSVVDFVLDSLNPSANSISGMVRRLDNGAAVKAVIIIIDSDLKTTRGAGGGSTFKKYMSVVTDTNGIYIADNIPASSMYNILSIPLDRDLLPMYFKYGGGTMNFMPSENLNVLGTIQNVNFSLPSTVRIGIGSIFGRVMVKQNNVAVPAPGTIVYATNMGSNQVVGYAISDSTGWYSISGLESGSYTAFAGNPAIGDAFQSNIPLTYLTYDDPYRTRRVDFVIDLGSTAVENPTALPGSAVLKNFPNPFTLSTTIQLAVATRSFIRVVIVDALGREVQSLFEGFKPEGVHTLVFDAGNLPNGNYFCRMIANGHVWSLPMQLMR